MRPGNNTTSKQPGNETSYEYELVAAIRVYSSIHKVGVRPEASF